MRFTTSGIRKTYTLMPARMPTDQNGVVLRNITGLVVSSGSGRIIDTDQHAATNGWTSEEKMAMERHLLSHWQFGAKRLVDRGEQQGDLLLNTQVWELWFADEQDIPAEHLEFCKELGWYKAWNMADAKEVPVSTGEPCIHTLTDGASVMRCAESAIAGSDYCAQHSMAVV